MNDFRDLVKKHGGFGPSAWFQAYFRAGEQAQAFQAEVLAQGGEVKKIVPPKIESWPWLVYYR